MAVLVVFFLLVVTVGSKVDRRRFLAPFRCARGGFALEECDEACVVVPLSVEDSSSFSRYCLGPASSSDEGAVDASEGELMAVVLAIRHGDRSPIQSLPEDDHKSFDCSAGDLQYTWDNLPQHFEVVSTATGAPLVREFRPQVLSGSDACDGGQLTPSGYRMHMKLGQRLAERYAEFLQGHVIPSEPGADPMTNMYVRSTDFTRTLGSATALLSGMLPTLVSVGQETPLRIQINEDPHSEAMFGIGLRGRRLCLAAQHASAQQTKSTGSLLQTSLTQLYGGHPGRNISVLEAAGRTIADVADVVYSSSCHGLPLPRTPGGCMDESMAQGVCDNADESYRARYSGAQGGARATELAMYPFLDELLQLVRAAAGETVVRNAGSGFVDDQSRGGIAAAASDNPPKMTLFSGHDSTLGPLLGALGVFDGRWPPYASRVAVELYRLPGTFAQDHFIRLVYNGQVLRGVRGCDEGVLHCPLRNFTEGIASILGSASSLDEACDLETTAE